MSIMDDGVLLETVWNGADGWLDDKRGDYPRRMLGRVEYADSPTEQPRRVTRQQGARSPAGRSTVCTIKVNKPHRKYCDDCWRQVMARRRGTPRRTDANQAEVVEALRDAGCCVEDMSAVGSGFPDLLVWSPFAKATLLVEVKNPASKGKLNKLQQEWHAKWRGHVCVVSSVDEALAAIGVSQ